MKKRTLISLAMFASVIAGLIIINACSKSDSIDKGQVVSKKENVQFNNFSPADEEIVPLIEAFNSSHKQFKQGYKSGEDIEMNEALWTLEAGVNYEFRSNKDSITNIVYDSIFVVVGTSIGENGELMANGDDLMAAYSDLLNYTNSELSEGGETNYLFMADVEVKEVNDETVTLKMTSAKGPILPRPWSCYVQGSDYWYPVMDMGYCDGDSVGLGQGQDASTRLNGLFNKKRCMAYACTGTVYFTNIDTYWGIYYYENQNEDNCFWEGEYTECLSPSDMNYWLDNGFYAIDGMKPTGKVFMDVFFNWDVIVGENIYVHYIDWVRYGKLNCDGGGSGS
jgi:hypothetical protein